MQKVCRCFFLFSDENSPKGISFHDILYVYFVHLLRKQLTYVFRLKLWGYWSIS